MCVRDAFVRLVIVLAVIMYFHVRNNVLLTFNMQSHSNSWIL